VDRLHAHRIIASIKDPKQIETALKLRNQISGVFLLTGHIGVIKSITTKTNVVKTVKRFGLITIQRFFLVDTEGLDNIAKSLSQIEPDIIEVMPARIPEVIGKVKSLTSLPLITGGLLVNQSQALECLQHGATGVSSSRSELWRESYPEGRFTQHS
jgi:glycerol uptake operon antiterminator